MWASKCSINSAMRLVVPGQIFWNSQPEEAKEERIGYNSSGFTPGVSQYARWVRPWGECGFVLAATDAALSRKAGEFSTRGLRVGVSSRGAGLFG